MKKIVCCLLAALTFVSAKAAFAEGGVKVKFCDEEIEFTVEPIIVEDRTLVQIRPIAEAMGLEIEFEPAVSMVILSDGETEVRFCVDSNVRLVDGKEVKMQVEVGQKVIYSKYSGTEIELDDKSKVIIVKQSDILAVIEK